MPPTSRTESVPASTVHCPCAPKRTSPVHPMCCMQMDEDGAPAAVVSALRGATDAGDWPLAGEAAWALELMGGMSRRLASGIG